MGVLLRQDHHEQRPGSREASVRVCMISHGTSRAGNRQAAAARKVGKRTDERRPYRLRCDFRRDFAPVTRQGR